MQVAGGPKAGERMVGLLGLVERRAWRQVMLQREAAPRSKVMGTHGRI